MTNKLIALFGLLVVVLTSCTHSLNKRESLVKEDSMTVSIKDTTVRSVPKISKKIEADSFGPTPVEESQLSESVTRGGGSGPSALVLSAGIYRTISSISLFKELKVINSVPPVLIGHGLSAVIASYFAFGFEADFIEWKFFQFIEKAKGTMPFSDEWNELFEQVLIKEIESKQIEEAVLTLIIPVWNKTKRKVEFLKRGNLKSALIANTNYYGKSDSPLEPAMSYNFIDSKLLRGLGVKKIYAVDLLSSGISWKKGNGLLNGSFQKAASIIQDEKDSYQVILNYPISEFDLDDSAKLADLIFLSKKVSKSFLNEFTKEEKL